MAAANAGSASARSASQSALIAPATAAASFATASSLATSSWVSWGGLGDQDEEKIKIALVEINDLIESTEHFDVSD